MSCGNSRSSKCNPCGPSADAMNAIADRAAYYARIAVEAANVAQLEDSGHARWGYIGDGVQQVFNLPGAGTIFAPSYIVGIDGVLQDPDNYTITYGDPYTLNMSVPVPAGSEIVIVSIKGITGATGPQGPIGPTGGPTGATGPISPAGGIRWAYTSDGFSTIYAISGAFSTLNTAYIVTYNGVTQDPINYTISAGSPYSITLSTAPAAGVDIVIVSLHGIQGATGPQGTPGGATGATGPVGPAVPSGGIRWAYTGNGSQTVFNITGASTTLSTAYLVTVDGVTQDPNNYTITAGSPYTLTISTVPSGSVIVITSLSIGLANWITGNGNPNGVVTANVGSIYTNLTGSSFSTLYVKESGSGNTGWVSK